MSFLVRGDSVKTFLFQNVNLIEIDKEEIENETNFSDEVSEKNDALDETLDEDALTVDPFVDEALKDEPEDEAMEKELVKLIEKTLDNDELELTNDRLEPIHSAGSLTLRQIMREEEFEGITRPTISAQSKSDGVVSENEDFPNDVESSQASDDQDETVINKYENNNDSAYETNEINSQNGSSRLQSAESFNDDVDTEKGESKSSIEIENVEVVEVEDFETNEEENIPIDSDDKVVVPAVNPTETGSSAIELTGNEVAEDKEVQFEFFLFPLCCIVHNTHVS